jgi:hypothetical protein
MRAEASWDGIKSDRHKSTKSLWIVQFVVQVLLVMSIVIVALMQSDMLIIWLHGRLEFLVSTYQNDRVT